MEKSRRQIKIEEYNEEEAEKEITELLTVQTLEDEGDESLEV